MERTSRSRRSVVWLAAAAAVTALVALVAYLGLAYHPVVTTSAFALGPATLEVVPVEPAPGSGGKHTWLINRAAAGAAVLRFELHNSAPFPVVVEPEGEEHAPWERELVTHDGEGWAPVDRVRIGAGESRAIALRFVVPERGVCGRGEWGGTSSSDAARLRVRYLGVYRRLDSIELPFTWAITCEKKMPPPYDGDW